MSLPTGYRSNSTIKRFMSQWTFSIIWNNKKCHIDHVTQIKRILEFYSLLSSYDCSRKMTNQQIDYQRNELFIELRHKSALLFAIAHPTTLRNNYWALVPRSLRGPFRMLEQGKFNTSISYHHIYVAWFVEAAWTSLQWQSTLFITSRFSIAIQPCSYLKAMGGPKLIFSANQPSASMPKSVGNSLSSRTPVVRHRARILG